jgi:GntR family transcriptional regulator
MADMDAPATDGINKLLWNGMARENLATRVANAIREQIRSGKLQQGSRLPGELELSKELGVSRQTLREATQNLTREGLLTIRHGSGTFVAEGSEQLTSSLDTMNSMSRLIREHGGESKVEALRIRSIPATAEIAAALDVPEKSPVAEIFRLRLIGSKPLAIAYDYIALLDDSSWKLPIIKSFDGGSIYQFMAANLKKEFAFSEAVVTAVEANRKHADLLCLKHGSPLLFLRETQFDMSNRRCLYSVIYHNPTMVEFSMKRPSRGSLIQLTHFE